MDGFTIITPTGGRPEAFSLCEKYVCRQTYAGPIQWIVVDDAHEWPASKYVYAKPNFTRTLICRTPVWRPGQNTLALNLLAAIPEVQYERVAFVEDDDWYAPNYLARMAELLEGEWLVGESHSRYYHVGMAKYRVFDNFSHASLCQTVVHATALPALKKVCEESADYIDVRLWSRRRGKLRDEKNVVGIKGLPGRAGIGLGHRPRGNDWKEDLDGGVLRSWVGSDAELYERYLCRTT